MKLLIVVALCAAASAEIDNKENEIDKRCADYYTNCQANINYCNMDVIKKGCQKTCGLCGSGGGGGGSCTNKYSNCDDYKKYCATTDWVKKDCQCTCGSGGGGGTTTKKSCTNKYSNCEDYKAYCKTTDWVKQDCQCTCGSGGGGTTRKPTTTSGGGGGCQDSSPACPGWAKEGACHKVKAKCKKSCGLC